MHFGKLGDIQSSCMLLKTNCVWAKIFNGLFVTLPTYKITYKLNETLEYKIERDTNNTKRNKDGQGSVED